MTLAIKGLSGFASSMLAPASKIARPLACRRSIIPSITARAFSHSAAALSSAQNKTIAKPVATVESQKALPAATALAATNQAESSPVSQSVKLMPWELKPGYQPVIGHVRSLQNRTKITAITTAVASAASVFFGFSAIEPTLAMAAGLIPSLAIGAGIIVNARKQIKQVGEYASLSMLLDKEGPALNHEENLKIRSILAGPEPKIQFTSKLLNISGSTGKEGVASKAVQEAAERVRTIDELPIPRFAIRPEAAKLVDFLTERRGVRAAVPLNAFNLYNIYQKQDRNFLDGIIAYNQAANILNYATGPSVEQAQSQVTNFLQTATDVPTLISLILTDPALNGSMGFMKPWTKGLDQVGIRVAGLSGKVYLSKDPSKADSYQFYPEKPAEKPADKAVSK